jgi:FkbM family methyltransferase
MTVVDVGANVGLYTAVAMHHIGSNGRIIAFEPHRESAGFLAETVRANAALCGNKCPQVDIVEVAAAAFEGEASLFCNPENKGDNRLYASNLTPDSGALPVHAKTVDSVLRDHQIATIDFLKLDVQGYEREVICGAMNTLRNSPNVIVLSE